MEFIASGPRRVSSPRKDTKKLGPATTANLRKDNSQEFPYCFRLMFNFVREHVFGKRNMEHSLQNTLLNHEHSKLTKILCTKAINQ